MSHSSEPPKGRTVPAPGSTPGVLQGPKGEPGKDEMMDYDGNISEALQVSSSLLSCEVTPGCLAVSQGMQTGKRADLLPQQQQREALVVPQSP